MKKTADTLILVPYNKAWAAEFEKLKAFFTEHLRDLIVGIEHIGSTSVRGLAAKPIIDLDVVIDSYEVFPEIVSRLRAIGFIHEGDLGVKNRLSDNRQWLCFLEYNNCLCYNSYT